MQSQRVGLFKFALFLLAALGLGALIIPALALNGDYGMNSGANVNAGPIWTANPNATQMPTNTYQPTQLTGIAIASQTAAATSSA